MNFAQIKPFEADQLMSISSRFASVYRDFQDVEAFLTELKDLLQRRG